MKAHIYIPVFATTLLLSASLLFSIQPLFSKMILPLLGGAPQVWNTAMLFFQVMLLAGYAYAHGTARLLGLRAQALLQLGLLALFTLVLPIAIPEGWLPPVDRDPTIWQLSVMAIAVGGPFFVLAGTAPMLQHWFSHSDHPDADNPYFLYGASNLGSMAALLAYPVVAEPLLDLTNQSLVWAAGYMVLMAMTLFAAVLVWAHGPRKEKDKKKPKDIEAITWQRRGLWLILAFVPSSLMLGVTSFITTDIASVPLLWIMPLALYVGTFILVFARKPIFQREHVILAQGILLIALIAGLILFSKFNPYVLIFFHLLLFFISALACHTELARSRPHASHLTEFYLVMSIGGALGGFFNAIVVPNIFIVPLEYALVLALAAFLRYATDEGTGLKRSLSGLRNTIRDKKLDILFTPDFMSLALLTVIGLAALVGTKKIDYIAAFAVAALMLSVINRRWLFGMMVCIGLVLFPPGYFWGQNIYKDVVHMDRNFFGVIKVVDTKTDERILLHGTTNHGAQALAEEFRLEPLSYYSKFSPLNDAFEFMDRRRGSQKVAVIGLGVGVTACFDRRGRSFDFFEIDPDIAAVAENPELFTFLSDCGSPYEIILGDGRLKMGEQDDAEYDMIIVDVYSSDNIPVHMITLEAIELYLQKLKRNGLLVFNISNNYLDIEPVLSEAGKALGIPAYARYTQGGKIEGTDLKGYASHFFLMSPDEANTGYFENAGWSEAKFREGVKLWTDQFSNIVSVLGNKTGFGRHVEIVDKEKNTEE